jgi:hypothetical protein
MPFDNLSLLIFDGDALFDRSIQGVTDRLDWKTVFLERC